MIIPGGKHDNLLAFSTGHRERRDDLVPNFKSGVKMRSTCRSRLEVCAEGDDFSDEFMSKDGTDRFCFRPNILMDTILSGLRFF